MESINLGVAEGLAPVDWEAVVGRLASREAPTGEESQGFRTWLATSNADGSPHVTQVGALWVDGAFWFQTGARTRKARNVGRDPRCSVAVSVSGADVVVEGDAARVTDGVALARIAKAWVAIGWPAEAHESGTGITAPYNAAGLGPAPWNVYRIEPRSAVVQLTVEPGGLTRFKF